MITIGQKVRVKNTDVEGIITVIDRPYFDNKLVVRIKITKGKTPITDYYLEDLELI